MARTSKMLAYGPQTPSFNSQGRCTTLTTIMHCPASHVSSTFPFHFSFYSMAMRLFLLVLALEMFRQPRRRSSDQLSSAGLSTDTVCKDKAHTHTLARRYTRLNSLTCNKTFDESVSGVCECLSVDEFMRSVCAMVLIFGVVDYTIAPFRFVDGLASDGPHFRRFGEYVYILDR